MHNHVEGMACSETCPLYDVTSGEADTPEDFKPRDFAAEMPLRDHFAGLAMAAWLSAPGKWGDQARDSVSLTSKRAYDQADAMMTAREAKRG